MSTQPPIVAYVLKRWPRLTETFILNEIRTMEQLGATLVIFSLLPPEPPPHHSGVSEVRAPVYRLPSHWLQKLAVLLVAHGTLLRTAPRGYFEALGKTIGWSWRSRKPSAAWKDFVRAGFVAARCRDLGVTRLHAHFANTPTGVAQTASLMSAIPYSFTAHAKDIYLASPSTLTRRIEGADMVATCTAYNLAHLSSLVGEKAAAKIELVYHGIDLANGFKPDAAAPSPAAAGNGSGRVPLVLSVGRLVPKKGHDTLIAACADLRAQGLAFTCKIVGAGPLKADLQAQIEALGLTEQVKLAGAMNHAELRGLYAKASLFVLAPRIAEDGDRDGIPNVIAEAMAMNVPVISTATSGIPEIVRDGESGLLVESDDATALAGAMKRLISEPEFGESLSAAASARLAAAFDLHKTTQRLFSLMGCQSCAVETASGQGSKRFVAEAVS